MVVAQVATSEPIFSLKLLLYIFPANMHKVLTFLKLINRVKPKGAAEMLVKRHLGVICDTITKSGVRVSVRFVSTTENKADCMSRVPKAWLGHRDVCQFNAEVTAALSTGESVEDAIWAAHLPHLLGIDRTLYLAKQIISDLSWEQIKLELTGCQACQRIDPALKSENIATKGS